MNEDQLIALLKTRFNNSIGDDCFIIEQDDYDYLVTSDLMTESVHFGSWMDPYSLGWKIAAVNISDIAAMGGKPLFLFLDLALRRLDEHWINLFLSGFFDICSKFNLKLCGGDTTKSEVTTVAITAIGKVPHKKAILRSGADIGDSVYISGFTGLASYGLEMLQSGRSSEFAKFQLIPEPEVNLALKLQELGLATAMIDLSDGIYQDCLRLAKSSGYKITLQAENILKDHPLAGIVSDDKIITYALTGGEDYRLLFTSKENEEKMYAELKKINPNIRLIGKVTKGDGLTVLSGQTPITINSPGFTHFGS